jgi:drug/metabolite transporter (DMT)-like permease
MSVVPIESRLKGILWMTATMGCFIALDAVMKLGLERYSLVQVTWGRFFFATIFAAAWCGQSLPKLAVSRFPRQQLVRSALLMITTLLFNAGISKVALPTATTVMFMTPIVTTVLAALILKEVVGIRRWFGIALGFAGAMVVVQPWQAVEGSMNTGVLLVFLAAFSNASYQIVTRSVRNDDPRTSLLFTAAVGALAASLILPWHWTWPDSFGWVLLVASGFLGMIGHLCIIAAFRAAPASVVAPFSYTSLLWATLAGYLIWSDWPQANVWYGAALIISAGLYILWREHVRSRTGLGS